jgi:uncharacterized protein YeaC (DUF1315 family)
MVKKHMELRQDPDGPKLAWDLKAESMVKMIAQARDICEANNRKFTPRDVLVWEDQENLDAQKKIEQKSKPALKKEKT